MPTSPSPHNIHSYLLTLAPLTLARTQRLVSSWLPPPTAAELQAPLARSDRKKESEEEDSWPVQNSELAGLGAKATTTEDESEARTVNSDEKLRTLLLGKDWVKKQERTSVAVTLPKHGSKPRPAPVKVVNEGDESEEEGGRSSLGKSKAWKKNGGKVQRAEDVVEDVDDSAQVAVEAKIADMSAPPKRARSYLDEVLAENAARKQKRQKRKKKYQRSGIV